MLAVTRPSNDGRVSSEAIGPRRSGHRINRSHTVSLDAHRHQTGGSITVAVTGTDNPVPSEPAQHTPSQPTPVVPDEADPTTDKRKKKSQ